jgi:spore photoproduct lyase
MFSRILIERNIENHPRVNFIREKFPKVPIKMIDKVDDVFGRVKKPYLHKRTDLQLFLGEKKGQLVKEAPNAYGTKGESHFYFIHAYNCIYECEYCYLQGYFNSPDLVFFLNHEEIGEKIKELYHESKEDRIWFHAGEFSDSLAMSHLTGELPYYFELFKDLPKAKLELRTKSVNIKPLLELVPQDNIVVTFSLSPEHRVKRTDLKTPPLKHRLEAIKTLAKHGYKIGIHLDPVIFEDDFRGAYQTLLNQIIAVLPNEQLEYLSLGVVRFTKEVYHQVSKNYPDSDLHASEFQKTPEGLVRYPKPLRMAMLHRLESLCYETGIQKEKVYLCMED